MKKLKTKYKPGNYVEYVRHIFPIKEIEIGKIINLWGNFDELHGYLIKNIEGTQVIITKENIIRKVSKKEVLALII